MAFIMLLDDVFKDYEYWCLTKGFTEKTMINKRQEYKQLKVFLNDKRGINEIESIDYHDMRAYIRYKQQSGLQASSIVSMAKQVKAFLNWCVKEGYLTESPMDKVDLPKQRKKVLNGFTSREVAKMIDSFTYKNYLEARNKAIIAIMADCGLRAIEIRRLRNKDVKETSILVNGKGNKERVVFISPVLKRILIRYEREKRKYFKERIEFDDNYFLNYKGYGISHAGLWNAVREAGKRAKIKDKRVSPHTFRHFYAVKTLESGIDVYSLSRLLGHSDVSTTQRYLQSLTDSQLSHKAQTNSPLMNLKKE